MNKRSFTSLSILITFVVVTVTGFGLIFVPRSLGITGYMKDLHEYISYPLVVVSVLHILYNIKPLKSYFSNKGSKMTLSKEFIISTALSVAMVVVIVLSSSSNMATADSYPTIESLPLEYVLESSGIDYTVAIDKLKMYNVIIPDGVVSLGSLSRANELNPRVIYGYITKE